MWYRRTAGAGSEKRHTTTGDHEAPYSLAHYLQRAQPGKSVTAYKVLARSEIGSPACKLGRPINWVRKWKTRSFQNAAARFGSTTGSVPGETAVYVERFVNYGLTREELQAGRLVIGIAQSGSDLTPCNRIHMSLVSRVKEGIRDAGGIAFEFPMHPFQESCRRPTAALDRNLAYLALVEILCGYPFDGVVLMTACDKTTPACLMAAATVNLPAIVLSGGPMLNSYVNGKLAGSGMALWESRRLYAAGQIDAEQLMENVCSPSTVPSAGHCNSMGTALSMNSLAEALGMSLPGCAAIPAPHSERAKIAYLTGKRIVEMVNEDLTPSRILTREAFENTIVVASAIGASTNCPPHIEAIARHIGVPLGRQGLGGHRARCSTARQHSTVGRVSGRRFSPRWRHSLHRGRIDPGGKNPSRRAHGEREDDRRELWRGAKPRAARDSAL